MGVSPLLADRIPTPVVEGGGIGQPMAGEVRVERVSRSFGTVQALDGVSLEQEGERVRFAVRPEDVMLFPADSFDV